MSRNVRAALTVASTALVAFAAPSASRVGVKFTVAEGNAATLSDTVAVAVRLVAAPGTKTNFATRSATTATTMTRTVSRGRLRFERAFPTAVEAATGGSAVTTISSLLYSLRGDPILIGCLRSVGA